MTQRGILHLNQCTIDEIKQFVLTLDKQTYTEKLDGSNIRFGIDDIGFYTARPQFGGDRVYDVNDYPITYATTFQRVAHNALQQRLSLLIANGLKRGDEVECEVLLGYIPNAIAYDNGIDQIVFLHSIRGNVDLYRLQTDLSTVVVALPAPYTPDGKVIDIDLDTFEIEFKAIQHCKFNDTTISYMQNEVRNQLAKLYKTSAVCNLTIYDLSKCHLNKRPDFSRLCSDAELAQSIRDARGIVKGVIDEIQRSAIRILLGGIRSSYGGEFVEGIVCTSANGSHVKIVDKDTFITRKHQVWEARDAIAKRSPSVHNSSVYQQMLINIGTLLGEPRLGTTMFNKYAGDVTNLSTDIELAKQSILTEINNTHRLLTKHRMATMLDINETQDVYERTMQVHSVIFSKLVLMENLINKASNIHDILNAMRVKEVYEDQRNNRVECNVGS